MHFGHPDDSLREDEEVDNAVKVLLRSNYPCVCVVSGGFFAVHEYIRRINRLEWLVDHRQDQCEVCRYYLLSDTIQRAVEMSSEIASKTGIGEGGV